LNIEAVSSIINAFTEKFCVSIYMVHIRRLDFGSIGEVKLKKAKATQALYILDAILFAGVRPGHSSLYDLQDLIRVNTGVVVCRDFTVDWVTYREKV